MIGTLDIKVTSASPQKPLSPIFSFKGSPSSLRLLDIPKNVGTWSITSVYVIVKNPDNTTSQIDCVRTGNVWVGTFNGCTTSGKVLQGVSIMADGVDENNQPVEGYCLGKSDYYVIEGDSDIKALVGKTSMRLLDSLPTSPVKGDVVELNGAFQMFDGSEWVGFGGSVDLSDYYTKEQIDSTLSDYATSESVNTSLSALASSFNDSIDAVNASVSALATSVSSISTSVSRLASSITSLSSTKRDYNDITWKYTRTTDPVMYGVKKFYVTKDEDGQQSHTYDLMDFDETNKVWSEYEAPITIKAYSPTLYAVIDENNPHTFEYDDEEYNGWEFYRLNDTTHTFTVSGGGENIEYHINLSFRGQDEFGMKSDVDEKRDRDDLTWDYPMDADNEMFGVGYFTVDTGTKTYLREFSNVVVDDDVWKTWQSNGTNGWKIDTLDGHHYNLYRIASGTATKYGEFTRTSDENLRWDVASGQDEVLVNAYRRQSGRLAVYEPNVENENQKYLMFGQSSSTAGVVICDDVSAKANSFIKVDDMMITGPNYTSSRGVQTRGTREVEVSPRETDNHLKVNGSAIAFVNEIETATSQLTSEIETVTASVSALGSSVSGLTSSVSAMASTVESVSANVGALGSSVSALGSSVSALGSSIETMGSSVSALGSSVSALGSSIDTIGSSISAMASNVEANTSSISAIVSSLSSYATTSYVDDKANSLWRTWEYEPDGLKFRAEEANSTVAMTANGSAPSVSLEYTTDGYTWNDFIVGTTTVTLANVGDKMWMRASGNGNETLGNWQGNNKFVLSGSVKSSGSVMYLLNKDGSTTALHNNAFPMLFFLCDALTTSPELPATTLAHSCYTKMFYGCTSLTTAPQLPATNLASQCYDGMFENCTSLSAAPELPATTLAESCYRGMFNGCSSLKTIRIGYTGNFSGTGVPLYAFGNWVNGVSSSGTFYYNGSDTTRGASAIPSGWTVQTF